MLFIGVFSAMKYKNVIFYTFKPKIKYFCKMKISV